MATVDKKQLFTNYNAKGNEMWITWEKDRNEKSVK